MTDTVSTALISAGAAVATAITALLVNHRGFGLLDKRIDDTNQRITELKGDTNRRLESIETDLKEFFKVQADHDKRITRLEDKK
jgi:hypothetical protein